MLEALSVVLIAVLYFLEFYFQQEIGFLAEAGLDTEVHALLVPPAACLIAAIPVPRHRCWFSSTAFLMTLGLMFVMAQNIRLHQDWVQPFLSGGAAAMGDWLVQVAILVFLYAEIPVLIFLRALWASTPLSQVPVQ